MDGKSPVIEEERTVPVGVDEVGRLARHTVFYVLALGSGEVELLGESPGGNVAAGGAGATPVGKIRVESLLQRAERLGAQVPFAEVAGAIPGAFENLG